VVAGISYQQKQKQKHIATKETKNLEESNITTNLLLNMSSDQGNAKLMCSMNLEIFVAKNVANGSYYNNNHIKCMTLRY
jgi:hypothetical protein